MWSHIPRCINLYEEHVRVDDVAVIKRGLLKTVIHGLSTIILVAILAFPSIVTYGSMVLVEREVSLDGWSYEQVEAKIKEVQDRSFNCPCEYEGIIVRRIANYNLTMNSYTRFVHSILAMCRRAQIDSSWELTALLNDSENPEGCRHKWLATYGPLSDLIASSESMAYAILQDLLDIEVRSPQFLQDDALKIIEQDFTKRFIKGSADRLMSLVNFTSAWAATNRFVTSAKDSTPAFHSNSMRIPVTSLPADFQMNSSCKDKPFFLDAKGFLCQDWKGYPCLNADADYQYTQAEIDDLVQGCRATCGLCPKKKMAVDDLGMPCRGVRDYMTSPEGLKIPFINQKIGVNTIRCLQTEEVGLLGVVREHCFNGGWRTLSTMAQWLKNVTKQWQDRAPSPRELRQTYEYACTEFDKQMLSPTRVLTNEYEDDGSTLTCLDETKETYGWITCKAYRHIIALAKEHLAAFTFPLDALRQGFLNVSSSGIAINRSKYHKECNAKTLKWTEKKRIDALKVFGEIFGVIGGASTVVGIFMKLIDPVINKVIKDQPTLKDDLQDDQASANAPDQASANAVDICPRLNPNTTIGRFSL